ncbi:hypothetical protein CCACVL1_08864 [Corchorus capsularis]|uniref:Uncharacterized protein n=1 Tax=Corchorus capsularis TaxID=210143 RepID=A0A1R3IYJ1_COCAP|nr:hypothetical protein CCACVL1_08864 [Corchorus capsularis]
MTPFAVDKRGDRWLYCLIGAEDTDVNNVGI